MNFLKNENKVLLLNILNEGKINNKYIESNFDTEVNNFYNSNNNKIGLSLLEFNKLFLSSFIKKIKEISYTDTNTNTLFTHEQLQEVRMSEFDKELKLKQNDFNNTITLKKPKEILFSESLLIPTLNNDEMLKIVQEKINERNNEMEELKKTQNASPDEISKWLKNEDTSLQHEIKITNEDNINILKNLKSQSGIEEYKNIKKNEVIQNSNQNNFLPETEDKIQILKQKMRILIIEQEKITQNMKHLIYEINEL